MSYNKKNLLKTFNLNSNDSNIKDFQINSYPK